MQPRQFLAVAALALGLTATVVAGPSTALAAKPPQGGESPVPTGTIPGKPQQMFSTIDLMAGLYPSDVMLSPGEAFEVPVIVANLGNTTATNVRVDVIAALPFQNVHVVDAAGFTCSAKTVTQGYVQGHWITCTGGQVQPAPGPVILRVGAQAPQAPGSYRMIAEADMQNQIVELDGENNNAHDVTYQVH